MERKILYGIIAVIVVIVVIVAGIAVIFYKHTNTSISSTAPTLVSITPSTQLTSVGSAIKFVANVKGNVTTVFWSFGDGTTGTGLIVNHTYMEPGKYLVFANATGPNGYSNNLKNLWLITVSPPALSPAIASEVAQPLLTFNTTANPNAPIFSVNKSALFEASYLHPPSATNWTIGYYVINYGDGSPINITPTLYNASSGIYLHATYTHVYTKSGFYTVNITLVTYNETSFISDLVTNNVTSVQYLPLSYYNQVLSSEHQLQSYLVSIYVAAPYQSAGILKAQGKVPNPGIITAAELTHSPYSLDPAIDNDWPGMEIFANVYETLVAYNGSSTSSFVPVIAQKIPTIENGGISSNGLNYTFYIRHGLKFSNGDPITVWDVYTSIVRTLLFMQGSPGTPGWIIAQDLLPGGGWASGLFSNGTALYNNITRAITYNNTTQSITFHLLKPDLAFLDYLADPEGGSILDYNWLTSHGAGITFTPQGFLNYTKYSYEQNYNTFIEYHAMGSGPYIIQSYLIGQSIMLVPNPNFTPIPGYPGYNQTPTNKVYIDYLKDPETAILMMESGQADITFGLPPEDYVWASQMQSKGELDIYTFPTLSINFYLFNWNVNITLMHSVFGYQYNLPPHYFANPLVRKAFAYSFDYNTFINNILGNKIYGADFGFHYTGIIPKGMPGYVPPNELYNVPTFNLTLARQFMMESGEYNVSVNIPVAVYAGDQMDYAATSMWAQNLSQMDPNIHITPIYMPGTMILGYLTPNGNPMPLFNVQGSWGPDYPYPPDYLNNMYLPTGFYPNGLGMNYTNLISYGYAQEASEFQNMTKYIINGDNSINQTVAFSDWKIAEQIAVNLTLYVYTYQQNGIWYYAPWIHGVEYEENTIFAGSEDTLFFYLTKG
ncbi:MAG TPA: PKD domain-containing protein [Euryarchaeota archaeon]|nr:PKD domain-containing protein [Euryarchaeota archaeon]